MGPGAGLVFRPAELRVSVIDMGDGLVYYLEAWRVW